MILPLNANPLTQTKLVLKLNPLLIQSICRCLTMAMFSIDRSNESSILAQITVENTAFNRKEILSLGFSTLDNRYGRGLEKSF